MNDVSEARVAAPAGLPIAEFVKKRRKQLGMRSQADLARRTGLCRDFISQIERGAVSLANVRGKTLYSLAVALAVSRALWQELRATLGPVTGEPSTIPTAGWASGTTFLQVEAPRP
jgi:transcriptional regulator with XRE-family HTH domain